MLKQEEISILKLKTSWLAFSKNVVLSSNGNAEKFFPEFYRCISDTENPFGEGLKIHASLLLGFEIANHLLGYLSGGSMEKDSVVQFKYSSEDISDKEKSTIHHYNLWSNEWSRQETSGVSRRSSTVRPQVGRVNIHMRIKIAYVTEIYNQWRALFLNLKHFAKFYQTVWGNPKTTEKWKEDFKKILVTKNCSFMKTPRPNSEIYCKLTESESLC